jgi:hypothetical protein
MKTAYSTGAMGSVTGVTLKAEAGKWTAENVELLDMVVDLDSHTAVITDILYDENGKICFIEVSEAMPPTCRRWLWDMEAFKNYWIAKYNLYNYAYLDRIPYTQNQYVNVDDETGAIIIRNYTLMPEYGDKFNYTPSSTKQVCHILETNHSYTKAIVKLDGIITETIPITSASTSFNFSVANAGYLEMYLEDNNGNKSHSVYGCVVSGTVSVIDSSQFSKGKLTISYSSDYGTPVFFSWGAKSMANCIMLDRENDNATILNDNSAIISFSSGSKTIAVAFENEYGIFWTPNTTFTVQEGTGTNSASNALLAKGGYWENNSLNESSSNPVTNNNGNWTYTKVPVEGNVIYKSNGATRIWFFDCDGNALTTIDASVSNYQFTTPASAAFMSVTYDKSKVSVFNETVERI